MRSGSMTSYEEDVGRTGINISDDNLCAFVGEKTSGLSTNALSGAGDNGDLTDKHALWEVWSTEVACDLLRASCHCGGCGRVIKFCRVYVMCVKVAIGRYDTGI